MEETILQCTARLYGVNVDVLRNLWKIAYLDGYDKGLCRAKEIYNEVHNATLN